MYRLFFILLLFTVSLMPRLVSADYLIDDQIFSGTFSGAGNTYADIHFKQNGNNFGGKIFFEDVKIVSSTQLFLGAAQKNCTKQLRWFYINTARGNRIRPLDTDSLIHLKSVDASYNSLSITGWLFICNDAANSVVGYVQHTRNGEQYSLVAGLEYNFFTNIYQPFFAAGGNFLFINTAATWYLWDSYGGIGQIIWSGLNILSACGNAIVESGETCDEWSTNGQIGHCNSTCNGTVAQAPSGWGGWGYYNTLPPKDICPNDKDCSATYYDGLCWTCPSITTTGSISIPLRPSIAVSWDISNSPYSHEINEAYQRAYSIGITTIPTIQKANLTGTLIRKYAAKMISEFAINVLKHTPDNLVICNFNDLSGETFEVIYYAKLACKLGLMWLKYDGTPDTKFSPDGQITRAQFGTILSRLLYGSTYNNTDPNNRYQSHLKALKTAGVMTNITHPTMVELRGRVLVMMMRVNTNTQKNSYLPYNFYTLEK